MNQNYFVCKLFITVTSFHADISYSQHIHEDTNLDFRNLFTVKKNIHFSRLGAFV